MKGLLGRKIGMTQVFATNGLLLPVTVIKIESNVVLYVNTKIKNGYQSLQLGSINKRQNLLTKPYIGQFKKNNISPKYFIKEIKNMEGYNIGDIININIFSIGEYVDITSISKGKGFSGSIKRHNYSRGPMSHGSGFHRGVGSMGAISPNRVFKSKKMPGHMGVNKVTIQNLAIVDINILDQVLLVKGSIPGPKKQLVIIKNAIKKTQQDKYKIELINRLL